MPEFWVVTLQGEVGLVVMAYFDETEVQVDVCVGRCTRQRLAVSELREISDDGSLQDCRAMRSHLMGFARLREDIRDVDLGK